MNNTEVIRSQAAMLESAIRKLAGPQTDYALLDFANHSNVGDSAIWLGEVKLLTDVTGRSPAYTCVVENFDAAALTKAVPDGPIFLHGGGNFGDVWPKHQLFREAVMAQFPGRPVIQFPQSIKFSDESSIARCAEAIQRHGRFHLFVRDLQSHALATQRFACTTELVPDAAFALGPLDKPSTPSHEIFMLLRTDTERRDYDWSALERTSAASADWLVEPADFASQTHRQSRWVALSTLNLGPNARRAVLYQRLAQGRLDRGLRMLASGRKVLTDRLHAHILCTLMDIPHVALDNNYGKIHGYIDAWTSGSSRVAKASTVDEAVQKVQAL